MESKALQCDTEKLEHLAEQLSKFSKDEAIGILQRMTKTAQTHILKKLPELIPQKFAIEQSEVKSVLRRRKVRSTLTPDGQNIGIMIYGKRPTLSRYQHSPQAAPSIGNRITPVVTVFKSRGPKVIKPVLGADKKHKGVFIPRTGGPGKQLKSVFFVRTGEFKTVFEKRRVRIGNGAKARRFKVRNGKEKIRTLQGMAIPQMVLTDEVGTPLMESLGKSLDRKIGKELNAAFKRMEGNV